MTMPINGVDRTYGDTVAPVPTPFTNHVREAAEVRVSLVIPTMNEALNLPPVLKRLPDLHELIIVDACSTDGTVDIVREHVPDARIIIQEPAGKGAAMRAGFDVATGTHIVAIDADGSMDPQEIVGFVALFRQGYDLVKGSREACGGGSTDITRLRRAGNLGLLHVYNTMFRSNLSDLCYGYIGFRRDCMDALALYADGFEIEAQILSHAALAGLTIAEVPSMEFDRIHGESNLNTFKDGRRVLNAMLKARFSPGRELWRSRAAKPSANHPALADTSHRRPELKSLPQPRTHSE